MKCSNHEAVIDAIMELYNQDRMEMSVVHGPYSVGKTYIARALQARLGKGHTIYLLGRLANESIHIRSIERELKVPSGSFKTLEDALRGVFQASLDKRIMLIIDDYPSFVDTVPQAPIILRDLMETYRDHGKVFVLLMGTYVDELKGRILGESSLIAAYIHNYFKVNPFTLDDVRALGWDYTDEDLVKLYHVTGGMPGNLVHIDPALSVDENIVRLFFRPQGILCTEPQRLLMRYIRNVGAANAILYALAQLDKPFYTELCHASELKSGTFATRMADLLDMEIIGRIQGGSRGPLRYADYHFVNTMFQFWYQFVFPNLEEINCGQGQYIYDTIAKPALDTLA